VETCDPPIRRGDDWPKESGYYVAYRAGTAGGPDVCYFNRRDQRWNHQGLRAFVTHYEDRKLRERRPE
jgi:hypothetical protein